jgi:hypothetical protein
MQPQIGIDLVNTIPFDLLLWGAFGATIVTFNVYSAILLWHWRTYSTGRFTSIGNMLLYMGVGAGLLLAMAIAALSFSLV